MTNNNDLRSFPINPWILIIAGGVLLLVVAGLLLIPSGNDAPTSTASLSPTLEPVEEIPYPDVPRLSLSESKARFDANSTIIVDVRSVEEYQAGHVPGAIVIPPEDFEARMNELPREAEILLYCT